MAKRVCRAGYDDVASGSARARVNWACGAAAGVIHKQIAQRVLSQTAADRVDHAMAAVGDVANAAVDGVVRVGAGNTYVQRGLARVRKAIDYPSEGKDHRDDVAGAGAGAGDVAGAGEGDGPYGVGQARGQPARGSAAEMEQAQVREAQPQKQEGQRGQEGQASEGQASKGMPKKGQGKALKQA